MKFQPRGQVSFHQPETLCTDRSAPYFVFVYAFIYLHYTPGRPFVK